METVSEYERYEIENSSYRTYEEWKPWKQSNTLHVKLRSYRTYEEWKPFHIARKIAWIKFLPYLWGMETWLWVLWLIRLQRFLPYLWGMETWISSWRIFRKTGFLPYLWGMETSHPKHTLNMNMRSYRTYEEWKPTFPIVCVLTTIVSFLPYLWGMETLMRLQKEKNRLVLTVPMRNGNFVASTELFGLRYVLTVPMRNGNPS